MFVSFEVATVAHCFKLVDVVVFYNSFIGSDLFLHTTHSGALLTDIL